MKKYLIHNSSMLVSIDNLVLLPIKSFKVNKLGVVLANCPSDTIEHWPWPCGTPGSGWVVGYWYYESVLYQLLPDKVWLIDSNIFVCLFW